MQFDVRRSAGFTLVEMMMVVAIAVILMAITSSNVNHVLEVTRGDGALFGVMSQLRQARDLAVARRRSIRVDFLQPGGIRLTRLDIPAGTTMLNEYHLEGGVRFLKFAGVPDTPDGYGAATAVDFDGSTPTFTAEGMAVDATGAPLSGTVFLGVPDEPASARAVTLFGGTGQVRGYTWTGTEWAQP
jgi:prepilin-type N-terminal cleavage/methylation domain-containing protein